MDWIKKNLVFVISCAVALIAIGVSGYYLLVEIGKYNTAGSQLGTSKDAVAALYAKTPQPGSGKVDNIKEVKDDIERLKKFETELTSTFKSIPVDATTEPAFKAELDDTLAYLNKEGKRIGLTIATNFNLSFTAQKIGFRFASNSLGPLSVQLADLREISKILVDARVNSIESFKRARVSADDTGPNAVEDDYLPKLGVTTNQFTGAVVYPYEVTFRCFSEEFGKVLEGIAHEPYSIILKTVAVEPGKVRNVKAQFASAAAVFGRALDGHLPGPGPGVGFSSVRTADLNGGGRPGEGGESKFNAVYGGAQRRRPTQPGATPYALPAGVLPAAPAGPETILSEEPIKVTLGFAVVRMPETPAGKPAANPGAQPASRQRSQPATN